MAGGEVAVHPGSPDTNWRDVFERMAWTAAQAFVGAIPATLFIDAMLQGSMTNLQTVAASGIAAAGASVLSFVKTLAQERLAYLDTRQ